ncbi:hypothetical protein B0H15DRAFT_956437 [Mycena belliarum]|uniref:TEA domain-containing protein n=1 Tax=Mycena belliarum TaxID=1033014 RepID=A0AAD6XHM7_9AGAR|nr:hypothetical protein B0H15DRAFT_956437 [Mycena belliae]
MSETSSAESWTPPTPSSKLPSPTFTDSLSPTQSGSTRHLLQAVIKERKIWKTSSAGEAIWPVELEAALLEGLKKYKPTDCRETRMLGRFPRRNKFISDYIFERTGKQRSAKQIGSRLQQLRESCGGGELLHLLSPFREPAYLDSATSGERAFSSPVSPDFGGSPRHTTIYIDILPPGPHPSRTVSPSDNSDIVHVSQYPRSINSINPLVSFTCRVPLIAHSRFRVSSEGLILHAETVPMTLSPQYAPQPGDFLYSTRLIPMYWKVILESPDPTRFEIFQEVVREDTSSVVFSATYKFAYPVRNIGESPSSLPLSAQQRSWLIQSSDAAAPDYPISLPDKQGPVCDDRRLWGPNPRETLPFKRYPSPGSSASASCFPAELSNMCVSSASPFIRAVV